MRSNEMSFAQRALRLLPPGILIPFATLFVVAGCGGRVSAPAKMVPLTLKSEATGAATVHALRAASLAVSDSDSSHVDVTFTRALLVVRDVRFHSSLGDSEGEGHETEADEDTLGDVAHEVDSVDGEEDGIAFRGPFVINLLSHHADVLDTKLVPPGLYNKVQGHLQALHVGDAAATTDLNFLIGSTVLLEGTISGEGGGSFTFQARIDDEFVIHAALTIVSDTPATAFLVFDLDRMLVDREGRFLDPRDPNNDQAIKSAIGHAIKIGVDKNDDGEVDQDGEVEGGNAPPLAHF